MNTVITDNNVGVAGWLFYDGECRLCCESARRVERILARRRFELRPLQSADSPERLGLSEGDVLRETRLLLADGRNLGGADAVVEIARHNVADGVRNLCRIQMAYVSRHAGSRNGRAGNPERSTSSQWRSAHPA